jgi:hypothetical protein
MTVGYSIMHSGLTLPGLTQTECAHGKTTFTTNHYLEDKHNDLLHAHVHVVFGDSSGAYLSYIEVQRIAHEKYPHKNIAILLLTPFSLTHLEDMGHLQSSMPPLSR